MCPSDSVYTSGLELSADAISPGAARFRTIHRIAQIAATAAAVTTPMPRVPHFSHLPSLVIAQPNSRASAG